MSINKILIWIIGLGLFGVVPGMAQTVELSGKVTDTLDQALDGASILLLQPSDSTLEKYAIAEEDGSFIIKRIPKGAYLLQVSFVGYQTYTQREI